MYGLLQLADSAQAGLDKTQRPPGVDKAELVDHLPDLLLKGILLLLDRLHHFADSAVRLCINYSPHRRCQGLFVDLGKFGDRSSDIAQASLLCLRVWFKQLLDVFASFVLVDSLFASE